MIKKSCQIWNNYWFSSSTAYQYGLFRLLLVGAIFGLRLDTWNFGSLASVAGISHSLTSPALLLKIFSIPTPLSATWAHYLIWSLRPLALMAFFGVATRFSLLALASVNLLITSVLNSFGFIDHATTIPSLALFALAFAPGVDACSVDLLWKSFRRRAAIGTEFFFGAAAPIWLPRLLLHLFALAYLGSGVSKVYFGGWHWIDGNTLWQYVQDPPQSWYFLAAPPTHHAALWKDGYGLESFLYSTGIPTPLAKVIFSHRTVLALASTATLLWELGFPVAVLLPRAKNAFLLFGVAFHLSNMAAFRLYSFYSYLACYTLFVNWKFLYFRLRDITSRIKTPDSCFLHTVPTQIPVSSRALPD